MSPEIVEPSDHWIKLLASIEYEKLNIPHLLALRKAYERGDLTEACDYQSDPDIWVYYRSLPSVT